jgi:hypothetical protein
MKLYAVLEQDGYNAADLIYIEATKENAEQWISKNSGRYIQEINSSYFSPDVKWELKQDET